MRLRSVINPPKRYEDEIESSTAWEPREPQQPQELRESRESRYSRRRTMPTTYVDFDPTLPAAAFPSLEYPHPPGEQNRNTAKKEEQEEDDNGVYKLPNTEGEEGDDGLPLMDYSHVPLEDFDNFVASNGPQNSQYAGNMGVLSQTSSSHLWISDDDDGEPHIPEAIAEEPLLEDPKWRDLSLSLQIEIADNMLEQNHIAKIQNVLSLSNQEVKELIGNLNKKDQDIEYENRILAEMRAKQLRALMYLDNSELQKYSVPEKLIMSRKSWARCHNVIKKNSKMKYLLCKIGDLRLARKFLSKRGLPLSLAGDWNNDYVANPTISNDVEESIAFTWKEPEIPSVPSYETTPAFQPGMSTTINPRALSPPTKNPMPQSSAQQGQYEGAESSAEASRRDMVSLNPVSTEVVGGLQNTLQQSGPFPYGGLKDKGKARDTSLNMPPQMPGSFSSESVSDLPLLRRISAWPTSTIIRQQWLAQNLQPDNAVLGKQEQPWVDIYGQVTDEQPPWDMGLTECHTAAKMGNPMMNIPIYTSSSATRSVLNSPGTDVDMEEDERQLEEAMLAFIDLEAYAQKPDEANDTSSQENPWGRLLKGVVSWAAGDGVAETVEQGSLETPQRGLSTLPAGQRYITPAQSSPAPTEEANKPTKKGKERQTPGPANIESPTTPPPTLPETRRLRSWHRKRLSADLGVESPTDKRMKLTDSTIGGHNLRARPIRPANKK